MTRRRLPPCRYCVAAIIVIVIVKVTITIIVIVIVKVIVSFGARMQKTVQR